MSSPDRFIDAGPCCCCGRGDMRVRNIVMMHRRAPVPDRFDQICGSDWVLIEGEISRVDGGLDAAPAENPPARRSSNGRSGSCRKT